MSDPDSDWLASDGESVPTAMEERDRIKAERLFETEGWREGISAGTAAALQPAFNKAFNEVGAPLGRRVGRARGTVDALARALRASDSESDEVKSSLAALDALAERLATLDWTTLSYPILDPHREGFSGNHNEPPPDLGEQHEEPAPDPKVAERVEQAQRELEELEKRVAQLQEESLGVLARSRPASAEEPRARTRARGQARKPQPSAERSGEKDSSSAW